MHAEAVQKSGKILNIDEYSMYDVGIYQSIQWMLAVQSYKESGQWILRTC